MKNNVFSGAILVSIIFALWNFDVWPFREGDASAYYQTLICPEKRTERCTWRTAAIEHYKIFIDSQSVVKTIEYFILKDNEHSPKKVRTISSCSIFSREEWECSHGYDNFGVSDGHFKYMPRDKFTRTVSKSTYYLNLYNISLDTTPNPF